MPAGRPSIFKQEIFDDILTQIAAGRSLVKALQSKPGYPKYSTFMEWLSETPELAEKYAKAKEEQADYLAEELMDISDEATSENVQVARLRVDTRKWIASKLKPKKYGEKVENTLKGDKDAPINLVMVDAGANPYVK